MILGYMPPCLAAQHVTHAAVTNAIFPGKICHGYAALIVAFSHFYNLLVGEFCVRMIFPPLVALLGYFIRHVIGARTQKMMRWITTWWVVAMMADHKVVWNWAIRQFVRDAMSQKRLAAGTDVDSSIAHWVCASLPVPAIIGAENVDMRPESIGNGPKAGIVSMNKPQWLTFYMAASVFIPFRYASLLPASAVAISVWNFFWGFVRGMITHVNSLLSAVGHSVGLLAQSPRFFVVSQVYYSIFTRISQVRVAS